MPIGSICSVIAGQSPPGDAYNGIGDGLPFYQGKKEFTDRYLAAPSVWTTHVTKRAATGDILMSVRAPVGPINEARGEICIGRGLAAIRNGAGVDRDYLWYALSWLQPKIAGNDGAVFPSINKSQIEALEIPLPPLDEQKCIVAKLDQAFAALGRVRENAETNLADADRLYLSVVEGQFAGREKWSREPLGARVRFIDYRGCTPKKTESGVLLLTAKNVRMGYVQEEPREFIATEAYASWMTRGIPKRGDVLFTTEAPLANVAQIETDEPVALAQRLITMQTPAGKIDPRFLKWSLMSPQMQADIKEKGTGATVTGIKAKLLKEIPLYVPDAYRQKLVAGTCEAAFHACAKLRKEIGAKLADITALRQSLLQAAFSGQLT